MTTATITQTKKLVLVDGSSYLFRAFHALPPLMTSTGIPTGAIYGVISMLRKLIQAEKPDYLAVIFDTKTKNFRHEVYPEYKANRAEMATELSVQIKPLHEIIVALGIPLLAIEGIEADDVIATLAHQASEKSIQTVISTGDKDLAQLVDPYVTLVNTMSGSILDEKGVVAKFGVKPNQIVDYLSLIGDSIDNIPGVPKVGPKTAAKWVEQYGTLENIMARADEITGKVGENLRQSLDKLVLGKKLVTVQRDVPLDQQIEKLTRRPMEISTLKALYQTLEFKSWVNELEKLDKTEEASTLPPPAASTAKSTYEILLTETQFAAWLIKLQQSQHFVIELQTRGEDPMQAELVGLAFAIAPQEAIYLPLTHHYIDSPIQLQREWVLKQLKPLLESKTIGKIGHNIKYTLHVLARHDIQLQNILNDTMLQSYILDSVATRHDRESLAHHYLQIQAPTLEQIVGKGAKKVSFDQAPVSEAGQYAAENAAITLQLHEHLTTHYLTQPQLNRVYRDMEIPLLEVLWQMEHHGIAIDDQKLNLQSQEIAIKLADLEEQAYILAGETFNLGSPKQLQEIFYVKLQLPILERTPKGAPSTAESVLQELGLQYELPRLILLHRTLSKLKSTYTDKLPLQINPITGRIHTSYQQAIAATGRLSSTDPNLQNIPIKSEEGRKIRQAFIPAPGYVLVSADYSQIELRIMAHLSHDEGLLRAFSQREDIHRFTASGILGVPLDQVTTEQRRSAKAINFGLIYGMSAFGLAKQLDVEREAAQEYMNLYFKRYPSVKKYMEDTRLQAANKGYVETIFGRRLYLPDIRAKHGGRRKAAERAAINAPMQGTAADIIKKAMISLHQALRDQDDIRMLLQVHDELIFEVKPDQVERAKVLIRQHMENAAQLAVPLEVDIGVGKNWDEAH